jgi:riboflavin kinase/FMN adenylyltransferase
MACHLLDWNATPPEACRHGAVSIGNFDGVHLGHAALLRELRAGADAVGGPAVTVTFDPHPLQLLRPAQFQPVLTTLEDRAALLQKVGADHVLILRTTPELLHLRAEEFFNQVVRRQLDAKALVEGENFGFGRGREGTVATLQTLCGQAKVTLAIVPPFTTAEGRPVSSSRVRDALVAGDVRGAIDLMHRPYRLRGTVATGQRRGATIGFPTANLESLQTLVPKDGVYAGRAVFGGQSWPAAINVGPNPTFGENARKVEVHLLDFSGDLYGQVIAVDFLDRLRDTRPFPNVEALVAQLKQDVETARRIAAGGTSP